MRGDVLLLDNPADNILQSYKEHYFNNSDQIVIEKDKFYEVALPWTDYNERLARNNGKSTNIFNQFNKPTLFEVHFG